MDTHSTQPSLLSRVRDPENHAAWSEFEAKYRELLTRYCRARGLQPSDSHDVCQQVLINLSKALRNFEYDPARGRFRDYLGRVVRNAINSHFSRPKRGPMALDTNVLANLPARDEADDVWEQEWVRHHYRLALTTIRQTFEPRSVEIFDRLIGGETVEALSAQFDMSAQAVHKVKQRIRNRMQELIAAQIREEDIPDAPTAG